MIVYSRDDKIFKRTSASYNKFDAYLATTAWSDYEYERISIDSLQEGDEVVFNNMDHTDTVRVVIKNVDNEIELVSHEYAKALKAGTDKMAKDTSNQIDKNIISEMKAIDKLPIMIPDENTPINTIVYSWSNHIEGDHNVGRFFKGIDSQSGKFLVTDKPDFVLRELADYAKIDIEADLQFRAFLNTPKEYRWFAIDSDRRGFVYRNKPILDAHNNWLNEEFSGDICNVGASIGVGLFLQYAELFGKILIERKD